MSKNRESSTQAFLYEFIQNFWDLLFKETKIITGNSYEMGRLHYQRGKYFLTKMENSLKYIEIQSLPQLKNQLDFSLIPMIQKQEDNPQNLSFSNFCNFVVQKQMQSQRKTMTQQQIWDNGQKIKNKVSYADFKSCQQSIEEAIRLFENQLMLSQTGSQRMQVQQKLYLSKGKRAILYMIGSQYLKAAHELRQIISELQQNQSAQSNQLIAEYTFLLGNCLLLNDQAGCENQALSLFTDSLEMYMDHLQYYLQYDISAFQQPFDGKIVDRFPYLNRPDDSSQVKLIKEVMNIILDKIEDVHQLISIKRALSLKRQQKIMKNLTINEEQIEKQSQNHRKRKPEPSKQELQSQIQECKQDTNCEVKVGMDEE